MRIRSVLTHAGEALFEGFLIATLVVGLVVGTTFAAKGGGGGGGGGGHGKPGGGNTTSSATLTVSPSPVGVGALYVVSGCGYQAGAPIDIKLFSATATQVLMTGGDSAGCFSMSNRTWDASSIRAEAWQYTGSWSLKATTSFAVQ